jgi:hypothetical protein
VSFVREVTYYPCVLIAENQVFSVDSFEYMNCNAN